MSSITRVYLFQHFDETFRVKEDDRFPGICNNIQVSDIINEYKQS